MTASGRQQTFIPHCHISIRELLLTANSGRLLKFYTVGKPPSVAEPPKCSFPLYQAGSVLAVSITNQFREYERFERPAAWFVA